MRCCPDLLFTSPEPLCRSLSPGVGPVLILGKIAQRVFTAAIRGAIYN